MKKLIYPELFVLTAIMLFFSAMTAAQPVRSADVRQADKMQAAAPDERRPNLLRELGLTPEQVQAVRRINQERKPLEQAARRRFQDANRALNMAIYADAPDDADVQSKLGEFQASQAELARIKFTNELAVRRLLTPTQLLKFRELRRRFAEAREEMREEQKAMPNRPLRRLRRGGLPPTN